MSILDNQTGFLSPSSRQHGDGRDYALFSCCGHFWVCNWDHSQQLCGLVGLGVWHCVRIPGGVRAEWGGRWTAVPWWVGCVAGSVQVKRCLLGRILVTGTTPQFRLKTFPSIKARREVDPLWPGWDSSFVCIRDQNETCSWQRYLLGVHSYRLLCFLKSLVVGDLFQCQPSANEMTRWAKALTPKPDNLSCPWVGGEDWVPQGVWLLVPWPHPPHVCCGPQTRASPSNKCNNKKILGILVNGSQMIKMNILPPPSHHSSTHGYYPDF